MPIPFFDSLVGEEVSVYVQTDNHRNLVMTAELIEVIEGTPRLLVLRVSNDSVVIPLAAPFFLWVPTGA